MARIKYKDRKFSADSLEIIRRANAICAQYATQGFDLTLRQLYYQFVSRAWLPNNDRSYKRLGSIVNDARLAGLIDWDYIVDRTRNVRSLSHWNDPSEIVDAVSRQFRHDKWASQDTRVEVWIEKDALVGVIEGVCQDNDVAFFSCRGYTSQSEIWGAAQRLRAYMDEGQNVVVIHLGDHDPSGIDMTRDIEDRLNLFLDKHWLDTLVRRCRESNKVAWDDLSDANRVATAQQYVRDHWGDRPTIHVQRIALNMDQIEEYDPPPNPAKLTDARAQGYIEEHGDYSWELDALDPNVLADLIQEAIEGHRDPDLWEQAIEREEAERDVLVRAARRWEEVRDFLNEEDAA